MPLEVYALSNVDVSRGAASSGGAFMKVAEAFFRVFPAEKKTVYGATFDEHLNVVHGVAHSLKECEKFCGSKYVRSNLVGVYDRIKEDLAQGGAVLFSGTPCQVFALKSVVKRAAIPDEKLLCIDLICHGCPKPAYWEAYREWLQKKHRSKLDGFLFRTKTENGSPYACCARFKNGKTLHNSLDVAVYNRLFLRYFIFGEGCFQCEFASLERQGDVTLGDFWGIESVMPKFPVHKHVSEVLINTQKGRQIMHDLQANPEKGLLIMRCTSDDYVRYQNNLQKPASKPSDYDIFQREYIEKGFQFVLKKYVGYDLPHRIKNWLNAMCKK